MLQKHSQFQSILTDDDEFSDALDEFIFFHSEPSLSSAVINHDSVSKLPDSGVLRFRRPNSNKFRLSDAFDVQDTPRIVGTEGNSSAIISLTDDSSVSDRSVTVNSPNTRSNFIFLLARLIIKFISLQTSLLSAFLTFPIRYPFALIRRYIISRVFNFLLGKLKSIVYKLIKRNKAALKLCLQIGWGLLWAAFIGSILIGLLVLAFVVGGAIMKCIMEVPVQKIIQLNFDYTRDTPMAYVPITSCPKSYCLDCDEKIEYVNHVGLSRVILSDHKLQATVSLTLPESNYNRNLGNFQVRVDFLSSNGKSLASTAQPCTLKFKSKPVRLLMTVFKLVPLIIGYSSESQTVKIKFSRYTEHKVPTSCLRVALEPRAEFADHHGGVPEIYTAYIKLESQLPLLKRVLWSWKATVFVWTSIVVFALGLVLMLFCCILAIRGIRLRGAPTGSG